MPVQKYGNNMLDVLADVHDASLPASAVMVVDARWRLWYRTVWRQQVPLVLAMTIRCRWCWWRNAVDTALETAARLTTGVYMGTDDRADLVAARLRLIAYARWIRAISVVNIRLIILLLRIPERPDRHRLYTWLLVRRTINRKREWWNTRDTLNDRHLFTELFLNEWVWYRFLSNNRNAKICPHS